MIDPKASSALLAIEQMIQVHKNYFQRVMQTVVDESVSNYPLLVVSSLGFEMGLSLPSMGEWQWALSTLEEAYVKKIVQADHLADFQKVYRERQGRQACVLHLSEEGAHWLFVPWQA
jgi:hypothetical protein